MTRVWLIGLVLATATVAFAAPQASAQQHEGNGQLPSEQTASDRATTPTTRPRPAPSSTVAKPSPPTTTAPAIPGTTPARSAPTTPAPRTPGTSVTPHGPDTRPAPTKPDRQKEPGVDTGLREIRQAQPGVGGDIGSVGGSPASATPTDKGSLRPQVRLRATAAIEVAAQANLIRSARDLEPAEGLSVAFATLVENIALYWQAALATGAVGALLLWIGISREERTRLSVATRLGRMIATDSPSSPPHQR